VRSADFFASWVGLSSLLENCLRSWTGVRRKMRVMWHICRRQRSSFRGTQLSSVVYRSVGHPRTPSADLWTRPPPNSPYRSSCPRAPRHDAFGSGYPSPGEIVELAWSRVSPRIVFVGNEEEYVTSVKAICGSTFSSQRKSRKPGVSLDTRPSSGSSKTFAPITPGPDESRTRFRPSIGSHPKFQRGARFSLPNQFRLLYLFVLSRSSFRHEIKDLAPAGRRSIAASPQSFTLAFKEFRPVLGYLRFSLMSIAS